MKPTRAWRLWLPVLVIAGAQCDTPTVGGPEPEPGPGATPVEPGGLQASAVRAGEVELTWTDRSRDETEFRIETRSAQDSYWLTAGTLPADSTRHRHTGLRAGDARAYRVAACNRVGCSAPSAEASAVVTAPAVPSELTATATTSGRIDLAWKDNSHDESGFEVEYRSGPGTSWYRLTTVNPDVRGLAHLELDAGDTFTYRVRACADAGCSAYSAEASATVLAPAAPSDLRAVPVGSGRIDLAWKDNSSDETGFRIEYREGSSTNWYTLATTPANAVAHAHTALDARAAYSYRVRACNASGCSEPTPEAQATVAAPAAPSGLTAVPVRSGRVNLAWQDNSPDETGFRIEYRESPGTHWYELRTVAAGVTSLAHVDLDARTVFTYRVRSCNASGCSDASAEVQATVLGPAEPTSLAAATPQSGRISLAWQDNSADETSFELQYRSATSSYWSLLRELVPETRAFVHMGLKAGDSYVYRVAACNASGCSDFSNEVRATVTAPAAPSNLAAAGQAGAIRLTWRDNSSDEDYFELQYRSPSSSNWSLYSKPAAGATSHTHSGIRDGDAYVYRIRSCDTSGCSEFSSEAGATAGGAPPLPPGGGTGAPVLHTPFSGAQYHSRKPVFSWSGVNGATAYRLMVAPPGVSLPTDKEQVACAGCTVNQDVFGPSFTYTGRLAPLQRYRWQVKARTAAGWTAWSPVFEFTTAIVNCPPGWGAVESGHAAVVCHRTFMRRNVQENDYAVVIDVQRGGGVRSLQDRDNDPPPGNPSPRFTKLNISEWWAMRGSRGFCVLNGVPFRPSPIFNQDVAQLSFPLREDHTLQTVGDDAEPREAPDPLSVLTVDGGTTNMRTYGLPITERSYAAVNNELVGVRLAAVSQRGDFGISTVPDDQTYAGVMDGDEDGRFEVVVFYLTSDATTAQVRDRLRIDFGVPDVTRMLRLDGGGSVQLQCGTRTYLRGDGRKLAQVFEISTERQ